MRRLCSSYPAGEAITPKRLAANSAHNWHTFRGEILTISSESMFAFSSVCSQPRGAVLFLEKASPAFEQVDLNGRDLAKEGERLGRRLRLIRPAVPCA